MIALADIISWMKPMKQFRIRGIMLSIKHSIFCATSKRNSPRPIQEAEDLHELSYLSLDSLAEKSIAQDNEANEANSGV